MSGHRRGLRTVTRERRLPPRDDLLATDDRWLDGDGTAPDVLR